MDAHDLFCRLGAGAKFDLRRFSADAARFQVLCVGGESGITEKEQEPENELTAGVLNAWRHRGLALGAFSLLWRSGYSQTYPVFCMNVFSMLL